ncbi:putative MFS family arabinose efflux permease [Lacibacter cauensis]|uniref:Putative MFS family arabinose efflux permease n=1 Tax=Lacibacter cauensis TaxID=510947 RepID=A0A562SUL5_9BACT|nr:MFS transporter [Lacibacter cauensis]TWI84971.1 putative MFS family arabinose efflux permease [Lacibacter cauensis]
MQPKQYGILSLPVIVGALGFFVDIYDLLLFNIVRRSSFADLGVPESSMKDIGEHIISWQMLGLTVGGILWGILGDKKGRKSVLFGSILLYSLATIANGFVQTTDQYTWLRFIAGLGLAGELGASITLTSELLPKEKRGIAAAIIATSGVMGTITAYFIHDWSGGDWRLCYFIGGGMGLALLFLRMGVLDSRMYDNAKEKHIQMGNFLMLINNRERFFRYMRGILIGLPVWYIIGVIISFSDEFAKQFGIAGFDQPKALMLQYVALAFGDMFAGIISNLIKSRKKTLYLYYAITALFLFLFFALKGGGSATNMYLLCMGLGFGSGISVLYITMSAEAFGTNLRATAAISIPNLVRGCLPLLLLLFQFLRSEKVLANYVTAAWVTGALVMLIGIIAVTKTKETFAKELDFVEL